MLRDMWMKLKRRLARLFSIWIWSSLAKTGGEKRELPPLLKFIAYSSGPSRCPLCVLFLKDVGNEMCDGECPLNCVSAGGGCFKLNSFFVQWQCELDGTARKRSRAQLILDAIKGWKPK